MQTYATLQDARDSLDIRGRTGYVGDNAIYCILEVKMDAGDTAYIRSLTSAEGMRHAMRTSGQRMGIAEIVAEHWAVPAPERTPADIAYDAVAKATAKADHIEDAGGGAEECVSARKAADEALDQWEADYPEAARARRDEMRRLDAERRDEIANRPGTIAVGEWRD